MAEQRFTRRGVVYKLENGLLAIFGLHSDCDARLEDDKTSLLASFRAVLRWRLEQQAPLELQRDHTLTEPVLLRVPLTVEPPRRNAAWREAVSLEFDVVYWASAGTGAAAYVPSLDLSLVMPGDADPRVAIAAGIDQALRRRRALRDLGSLARLQRNPAPAWLETRQVRARIATPLESWRAHSREEKPELELPRVATRLDTDARLPEAFEVAADVTQLANHLRLAGGGSILLVGPFGVGKTAIVQTMIKARAQHGLAGWEFWASSGARLVAGMTGFGMWQERCSTIIEELKGRQVIIHLGSLTELLDVGKSAHNSQGIASFLRPAFARGQIRAILECTPEQIAIAEQQDPQLLNVLTRIDVAPPDEARGRSILLGAALRAAGGEDQRLELEAVEAVDRLHRRFAPYSAYPGRPLRFITNLVHDWQATEPVDAPAVCRAFSDATGLPLMLLDPAVPMVPADVTRWLADRVIGQRAAIDAVVRTLTTVKAGLVRPGRPIASMVFAGPTGVGKTELAKTLANFLFRSPDRMIRIDMSEYADPWSIDRLIGYGFGDEGLLTSKVREEPFSVVLLDEFEKAHPRFYDLLLQVLGEGRLTDAGGRTADFCSTVIIMTSNLGAREFGRGALGFETGDDEQGHAATHFTDALRQHLRPEIFNRIDNIVPFEPLGEADLQQITDVELARLGQRDGIRFRDLRLTIEPAAVQHLAAMGFDPRYGARPLRRRLERDLLAPLADRLNGYAGDDALDADVGLTDDGLTVQVRARGAGATGLSGASPAERGRVESIGILRRQILAMREKPVALALRNEIAEFERLKDRGETFYTKQRQKRAKRFSRVQTILQTVDTLLAEVGTTEEAELLRIYGITPTAAALAGDTVAALRERAIDSALQILTANTEDMSSITLELYSHDRPTLELMLQAYLHVVAARAYRATLYYVNPIPSVDLPGYLERARAAAGSDDVEVPLHEFAPISADLYANEQATGSVVGFLLEIEGPQALAAFGQEAGVHHFIRRGDGDEDVYCLVDNLTTALDHQECTITVPGLHKLHERKARRRYDADRQDIHDLVLGSHSKWSARHLDTVMARLVEDNLRAYAAKVLES